MSGRRILITGIASPWGGRLAQRLEHDPRVEALVGIDTVEPRHELHRTECLRLEIEPALLQRILAAASIDTVIDTRLIHDSVLASLTEAREINVTATRSLLAACAAPQSPVCKVVFKSSADWYGADANGPMFLTEQTERHDAPRTALERDIVDAEAVVAEFAAARPRVSVAVVRFAEAIGAELRSALLTLLGLPVVPAILGFDPRCQFIHHDDAVAVLAHAALGELDGVVNAGADGVLALSEVSSLLGKPLLPVLPPWGTVFAAAGLRRLGLGVPVELVRQLRTGRGLDNRRLKASGFAFRYTTREAVLKLRAHQRLRPLLGSGDAGYRYEREVEEFLRRSPSVRPSGSKQGDGEAPPEGAYADLPEGELIELIGSLEVPALERLQAIEQAQGCRPAVLEALERTVARRAPLTPGGGRAG
ncbi:MAG TPA: NAD-dependent epimerase/dehydratase family protein [Solirubrobacteraceae bacterium]|nr:NAD-dependent epimerase/dehydratase family protein [Solirubrobacteraceae bacterium]